MSIIEVIILGIVQGLTEFIPVSSSGHLVIFHEILGVQDMSLVFDVALHAGTLLALILFFWRDITQLLSGWRAGKQPQRSLVNLLIVATIPAVIAGLLLQEAAETVFRSLWLVAGTLSVFGVIMLGAERVSARYDKPSQLSGLTMKQTVIIGLAQACAIVPGVSRSGSTISAGLYVGLDRVAATRFSFLLAIPIIFGATLKVLASSGSLQTIGDAPLTFSVGFLAAFISGLIAIRFLLKFVARYSIAAFAYYRFVIAGLVVIALLVG